MAGKGKIYIQIGAALGLSLLALFAIGVVIGYVEAAGGDASWAPWAMGVFAVAGMLIALWISLKWMGSIDEAAREAHKWAWFWGGSGGMALGGVLVIMAALPQAAEITIPAWYVDRTDPAAYAATGAFGMLLLMILGYAVAWVWWWLSRR